MKFSDLYKLDEFNDDSIKTIPEGTEVLEESDINFKGIKVLNLPKSLKTIDSMAVANCKKLEKVNFPRGCSLTKIGHRAFQNCSSLESIEIPNKVRVIGNCAFMGCTNLKDIKLPNILVTIYREAFRDCKSLEKLVIPKNVKNIGDRILSGSKSMKELIIMGDVDYIKPCAFCLENFETKGYSISFETEKKYPLSIVSYAPSSKEVPEIDTLRIKNCDIKRLKTESIDYESEESKKIIYNSLKDGYLSLDGLLSSSYLDVILDDFELLKDYLYDDLEKITPSQFNSLKEHFSPSNINNIYSIFNRFLTLNNTGNIVSYMSEIVGIKSSYRMNAEEDESQIVLSDLSLDIIESSINMNTSREEAFDFAKSVILTEYPNASDDFINNIVNKYYKGEDGKMSSEDFVEDARTIFDRETEKIAASKNPKNFDESKNKIFSKVLKDSQ